MLDGNPKEDRRPVAAKPRPAMLAPGLRSGWLLGAIGLMGAITKWHEKDARVFLASAWRLRIS